MTIYRTASGFIESDKPLGEEFDGTYRVGDMVITNNSPHTVRRIDPDAVAIFMDGYGDTPFSPAGCRPYLVSAPVVPVNPKAQYGDAKLPLHLWPLTATALGCMAFLEGDEKYGRSNFRATQVAASTYKAACDRHMNSWFEGEDTDPGSGLPHLAKALACIAVMIDSQYAGTLVDDRMYPGGYEKAVKEMTALVQGVKDQHADKHPKRYDIRDRQDEA